MRMQRISRAPVLSATRSRVSGWTIAYLARSTISVRRQRLVALSGRLSTTRTVSPMLASSRSSWAWRMVDSRTVFLYTRCWRRVSMRTTSVFGARSDTTTPWRTRGRPRPRRSSAPTCGASSAGPESARRSRSRARRARRWRAFVRRRSSRSRLRSAWVFASATTLPRELALDVDAPLARHGQATREVLLGLLGPRGVLELPRGELEAQVEHLLASVADVLDELGVVEAVDLRGLHAAPPCAAWSTTPSRTTNLVLTGSLWPARRIASRASGSGTPESSNMTRPGLTTATHPSGLPFPEPMRVSAGFAVTGLSGKTLIHTFPPRRILRVMAIRAASIWRLVTQPRSSALRPYSPNSTRVPPFELPRMRPRCCLRCLTRLGWSIRRSPSRARARRLGPSLRALRSATGIAAARPLAAAGGRGALTARAAARAAPAPRTAVAPAAAAAGRAGALRRLHRGQVLGEARGHDLALVHPHLDPDAPERRARLVEPVVDVGPQRVERHSPLGVALGARHLRSSEAPRD